MVREVESGAMGTCGTLPERATSHSEPSPVGKRRSPTLSSSPTAPRALLIADLARSHLEGSEEVASSPLGVLCMLPDRSKASRRLPGTRDVGMAVDPHALEGSKGS